MLHALSTVIAKRKVYLEKIDQSAVFLHWCLCLSEVSSIFDHAELKEELPAALKQNVSTEFRKKAVIQISALVLHEITIFCPL